MTYDDGAMQDVKVSVIIPVYNTEKYLEGAINSITGQTLSEIEIIVVNDGATDGSAKILQTLAEKDSRIKIITHEKNKRLSEARNSGVGAVQGNYLYFFDSDDILEADCLELCYNKSEKEKLDFLFFDAVTFYDEDDKSDLKLNYQRTNDLEQKVYTGIEILEILLKRKTYRDSACLSFINTSYLKQLNLPFIPGIYHEDVLFTLQLYIQAERVSFINRSFFHRRIRGNSIMGKPSVKSINDIWFIVQKMVQYKKTANNPRLKQLLGIKIRSMLIYLSKRILRSDVKTILTKLPKTVMSFILNV